MPRRPTASPSSLELILVTDQNSNGSPNWGDTVTFKVITNELTPNVDLKCYDSGGHVIYSATAGFYDGYPWPWAKSMTLKSTMWNVPSKADAIATLYVFAGKGIKTLANLHFTVDA